MHPDRKIGFAMGILLIGIVGALFFRNEPLVMEDVPQVRRERQLNDQLRARDVAVYLDERKPDSGDSSANGTAGPTWTLPEIIRNLASHQESVPLPVGATERRENPAPVDDWQPRPAEFRIAPPEDGGRASTRDPSFVRKLPPLLPVEKVDEAPTPDVPEPTGDIAAAEIPLPRSFEEYTVRYGDTLSGIAERFLGSSARFQEIYDANRDRMDGPDKLKVGKAIRIPKQL